MKRFARLLGIIAIVVMIGFSFSSCTLRNCDPLDLGGCHIGNVGLPGRDCGNPSCDVYREVSRAQAAGTPPNNVSCNC